MGMEIKYRNKIIQAVCEDYKIAKRRYGSDVAEKLYSAINFIKMAINMFDIVKYPPFGFHKLLGDRYGTFAIYLGKKLGFRLILIPLNEEKIFKNNDDINIISNNTKCILILEVTKHYE